MIRASLLAAVLLVTPAFANDSPLVELFDRDGPDVTLGAPGITDIPPEAPAQPAAPEVCSFDPELPVDDPCSGWHITHYVDFGDGLGMQPSYFHCPDPKDCEDAVLDPDE